MQASLFGEAVTGTASSDLVVERCSSRRGWKGLYMELGHNRGCDVQDMTAPGHMVGMQTTGQPLTVETYQHGRWSSTVLPSHRLFIHPAGTPLYIRHAAWTQWAIAVVDHPLLNYQTSNALGSLSGWTVDDDLLANLFSALLRLLTDDDDKSNTGLPLAQAMIHSIVLAMLRNHAATGGNINRGGITPQMAGRLQNWVADNLDQSINVKDMADQLGISPSHFAREFKRSTGMTPIGFLMDLRLTKASNLIGQGMALCDVAQECGFADQSHFSNAFKSKFGFPPSKLKRGGTV